MKKLAIKDQNACMACLTCELACAQAFYKNANRQSQNLSCINITNKQDKIKILVCTQCGKCAKTCDVQAITQNTKGVYMINKKTCLGCGKCIEACPFKVMVKADTQPSPSKCIACGICVKSCPMEVLYIKEDAAAG